MASRQVTRTLIVTTVLAVATTTLSSVASAAPTWLLPTTFTDGRYAGFPDAAVSPQGDAVVVYVAFVGGKQVVQATGRTPGGGWSAPVSISDVAADATEPHVVVDGTGNATAIWRRVSTTTPIQAAYRPAGGSWGAPTYLSAPAENALEPAIAVDTGGTVTAVWTRIEDLSNRYVDSASKPANGAWSTAETLATGYADRPTVAAGPAGVAVVAWVASDGVDTRVVGTVKGASGWTSPVPLSASSGLTEQPRSAVDGSGRAYVTWPRYQSPYLVVQIAEWAPGGGWLPAVDLSAVGADARVARIDANPAGHVVVGWTRSDGSKFRAQITTRSPGGAWETPVSLSGQGRDAVMRDVGIDASAAVTAVWTRSNGTVNVVQASHRPVGGAWGPVADLSSAVMDSSIGAIALDAGGDVVVPLSVFSAPTAVEIATLDVAGPVVGTLAVPGAGTTGVSLAFTATASDSWSAVASYAWSFGDGATATGASTGHAYAAPGTYPVAVTVTDAVGNATTRTATVSVTTPATPVPPITPVPVPGITTFKLKNKQIATDEKTKLKVRVNTAATLKLVLKSKHQHVVKGKKKYVKVVIKKTIPVGLSKITIKGTIRGTKLMPDTYVIAGTAKNTSGTSPTKRAKLVVVRP